ncbi:hypothetical protein L798_13819 [Zootermopsis nevadensis]|uniref:Uncharacterized protein n=1 Tax=Zootermopsis nevadensis TaxID=136037 RepID=A0A067QGN0_ZOONE|nr:hypothetical protein L798_13819 [Zootermopsis nevadensis]
MQTNIHGLSGIRTHGPSDQAAQGPRLRPRGYFGPQNSILNSRLNFPVENYLNSSVDNNLPLSSESAFNVLPGPGSSCLCRRNFIHSLSYTNFQQSKSCDSVECSRQWGPGGEEGP